MRKPCDSGSVLAEGHRSRLCSLLALITSFFFFSFSPHAGGSYIGPERWVNELLCFCVCVCVSAWVQSGGGGLLVGDAGG